jgi:hypothetical protein
LAEKAFNLKLRECQEAKNKSVEDLQAVFADSKNFKAVMNNKVARQLIEEILSLDVLINNLKFK